MGNAKAASIWEYHLPQDYRRPVDSDSEMESFIRGKYEYNKVTSVSFLLAFVDLSTLPVQAPSQRPPAGLQGAVRGPHTSSHACACRRGCFKFLFMQL